MNKSDKSHDTGLRIIEILKILLNSDADKQTIMEYLKENVGIENVYTNEAYLKYFNTLDILGLNIEKNDGIYCLKQALFSIELNENEEKILKQLIKTIPHLNNKKQEETIKKFILRLDKYVNIDLRSEVKRLENEPYSDTLKMNIVNTLKQLLDEESEVNISYKNRKGEEFNIDAAIKKIVENKGHYYVLCYNSTMLRCKRICTDYITSVKRSPKSAPSMESNGSVVYEVYGRLAKSYKLKSWETLSDFDSGFMRITNTKEDIDTLLHRLFKYGENCKILQPKSVVDEFLSLTNDVLNNLEEDEWQE